jgi:hypothetical protein
VADLLITPAELLQLTGYQRAADQLRELHRQGFARARRSAVSGAVILERAHYEAVARGDGHTQAPRVRMPVLRRA